MSKHLINQLILNTLNDKLIKSFTHDLIRFKNINSYNRWLKKRKVIYSLIDQKNNLAGILWFTKKKGLFGNNEEYPFTFAIRIYSSARNSGLAAKFMMTAFNDFMISAEYKKSEKKGFWLETYKENKIAQKLYKNFGFEQLDLPLNNSLIMVLTPE